MSTPIASRLFRFATLASALLAAGCVVVPADGYYAGGPVAVAPPPPQVEVIGVAPGPGYIWIGGFWNWVGNRHAWVSGHWAPQRPGHAWSGPRWYRDGPGWRQEPGRWYRR